MTIPTRDELIERMHAWRASGGYDADFTVAEIRRAVAEELESLHAFAVPRNWDEGGQEERARWSDILSDRLAALRQTESSALSKVAVGSRAPGRVENAQEELPDQGSSTAPALSDAALELVFEQPPGPESQFIEAEVDGRSVRCGKWVRHDGHWRLRITRESFEDALRAASAPVPVPKPVDVFERQAQTLKAIKELLSWI